MRPYRQELREKWLFDLYGQKVADVLYLLGVYIN